MLKGTLFIGMSVGLVYLSRACLRAPRTHGFYRFFAWELILALVLVNVDVWFRDPFSTRQIISWLLLIASLFLVIQGAHLLHRIGRPDDTRHDDPALMGIERTTTLVETGVFKYIRHPIYTSGLSGAWGVFLKDPTWLGGTLTLAASVFLVTTAKIEEAECIRYFGPAYQRYIDHTKMFIPFLL